MAIKKYIVKQKTNWNARGDKSGTSIVAIDSTNIAAYIALLDGVIEVYELNTSLSSAPAVVSTTASVNVADYITIKGATQKNVYISNGNKRPLVFKVALDTVITTLKTFKPFPLAIAELPSDVSADYGDMRLL